ncbi:MAG: flagellar hook-length control protein FliK [Planctomycetaceae bacterium]|jgi:hypothetical protein|nr:flagellar hook-length control protein FliK [Planctomycetaceae bacterium]
MDNGQIAAAGYEKFTANLYALRSSPQTALSSLLDVLAKDKAYADKTDGDRRLDQHSNVLRDRRQFNNQQTDAALLDRRTLNHSELRSRGLEAEYEKRLDDKRDGCRSIIPVKETAAIQIKETAAVPVKETAAIQIKETAAVQVKETTTVPVKETGVMPPASLQETGVLNTAMPDVRTANAGVNTSFTASRSAAVPGVTIFTSAGHLTQQSAVPPKTEDENESSGDDTDEDADAKKEKRKKKKTPFAAVTAMLPPMTEPLMQPPKRKNLPSAAQQPDKEPEVVISGSLSASKNTNPSPASDILLPEVPDNNQFLRRITAACESAVLQNAPIRLKLNLGQLGTLLVTLNRQGSKLSLRFETPSQESARYVSENLAGLRKILAERNVDIVELVVDNR